MSVCKVPDMMTGVVAQLHRYTEDGTIIESKLVFRPECDWFMKKGSDDLGEVEYTDVVDFAKDFGADTLNKVLAGKVVSVKLKPDPDFYYRGCQNEGKPFRMVTRNVRYPVSGTQEDLTRF